MADMNDIVKLAVDTYRGNVEKYSISQGSDVLRQALIDANNGSTTLNYKAIRDGKCDGLFTLVEEILSNTVVEGLQESDFFNALVEFRNIPLGDKNIFVIEDNSDLFTVAEIADGTQGLRRQRMDTRTETSIGTKIYGIRIYEELSRILAGRVDFNYMINKVAQSFSKKLMDDIYGVFSSITAAQIGGAAYFPTAGTYDEDALLDVIAHVEAASGGKTPTIIGTKKALRQLKEGIQSDSAKEELHDTGYYGKFFGTPCLAIPQRHKVGSTQFVMPDNELTILATDEKPIKVVREGDPLMIMGEPTLNGDLTQEYFYRESWGTGLVLSGKNTGFGHYEF